MDMTAFDDRCLPADQSDVAGVDLVIGNMPGIAVVAWLIATGHFPQQQGPNSPPLIDQQVRQMARIDPGEWCALVGCCGRWMARRRYRIRRHGAGQLATEPPRGPGRVVSSASVGRAACAEPDADRRARGRAAMNALADSKLASPEDMDFIASITDLNNVHALEESLTGETVDAIEFIEDTGDNHTQERHHDEPEPERAGQSGAQGHSGVPRHHRRGQAPSDS